VQQDELEAEQPTMTTAAETVHVYVASYSRLRDARMDYDVLTRRYADGIVHTYDATVISRELDGKLKVSTTRSPGHGKAWIGLAAGELGGLFFPPFLSWDDAMHADDRLTMGQFWRGLSRADLRAIAGLLGRCAAALIVISELELQPVLKHALKGRFRVFQKRIVIDAATAFMPPHPFEIACDTTGRRVHWQP
jgi:hypothetical protein